MDNKYKIPWAAWREPDCLELEFPDSWDVALCRMIGADTRELSSEDISKVILNPIGTPNLSVIAQGRKSVVIVVDDMTRTTPSSKILPFVFEELEKADISEEQITILFALGAHRPMNKNDCLLKLGKEIVSRFKIENARFLFTSRTFFCLMPRDISGCCFFNHLFWHISTAFLAIPCFFLSVVFYVTFRYSFFNWHICNH